jgi:RNA polymerase sigma-70 factor (ECF subfamily)
MGNAHIDSMRRKGRLKTTSLEQPSTSGTATLDVADADAAPDKYMLDDMMDEHVQSALMTMTPDFRTAVLLADVEGMAYEEIAEVMKTSVGTVRSRIHRGRKQLRVSLLKKAPDLYGGHQ